MTPALTLAQKTSVSRILSLTLGNALVFQEVLSGYDGRVEPLRKTLQASDVAGAFCDHWRFIVEEINYLPIFKVARELLLAIPANQEVEDALRFLALRALDVVRHRAALRHDLMGRVYHRLLAEAKYLGTFYTSVPAATLLLKVALDPQRWPCDWTDPQGLSALRVGDPACGTGTLLVAAAEAITDNHVRASAESGIHPDLRELHRRLMEDIVYGYDVLASAVHLTASTLSLRAPDIPFLSMHLYSLPLGGPHDRLGSVEFLRERRERKVRISADLFGATVAADKVTGTGDVAETYAPLPDLDLCVMNPPFTRSVGGNLLFGSAPPPERARMQKELQKILRSPTVYASSTAGLGSVFVALGHSALRDGGRMALVLPKAVLSGVAWSETRFLLGLHYQLEYLIVSHEPGHWNFSENTDLSEALVVARKRHGTEPADAGRAVCVNLWRNPSTAFEALSLAQSLTTGYPPDLATGQGALSLQVGSTKFGEAVSVPWADLRAPWGELRGGLWMPPCAYAQNDLLRVAHHLLKGRLYVPGQGAVADVPLCSLGQLGTLGPDVRDVHDGFVLSTGQTAYPAFWSHDAPLVTTLAQKPNRYLSPLPYAKPGRHLRRASDLWPRAGSLLLAERLWLKTQRLAAVRLESKVLSNVWWPVALAPEDPLAEKALALWLNSTVGLVVLLAHREETRGAWVKFKKPVLAGMPVLNVGALSPGQRQSLAAAYDRLCHEEVLPFPHMAQDPTRQAIDRAIEQALGLPDTGVLRQLLAREPVVCLNPLT